MTFSRLLWSVWVVLLPAFLHLSGGYARGEQDIRGTLPEFRSGVVAAAHPLATAVGLEILKKGGNAVDAAVATAFALGVVEPFASGIGGGGFMLIYVARSNNAVAIDYRVAAPGQATPGMFMGPGGRVAEDRMKIGPRSVAVPGSVAGLAQALKNYGTMELKEVMQPAINLAEQGFFVGKLLNSMMAGNAHKLLRFPAAARTYLKRGRPYRVGERFYQKDLAATYRLIAENGPEVFYRGAIAEAIAKEMKRAAAGWITLADLAAYRPVSRNPVKGTYRGFEIFSMGPPSSGGTQMIELLNILEGYDMAHFGRNNPEGIAIMAEAMKKVFSDRAEFMGDPDFVKIPLEKLLSKEHAAELRQGIKIKPGRLPGIVTGNLVPQESDQTTHLSVADKQGNLVALTQSLDAFFGSGVVVPGTGILLNDGMGDFAPQPGGPNSIAPGKRPLSNMSPTVVLRKGRPFLSLGMAGGTRIITAMPQILMNLIDHHLPLQEAIDAPRIHSHSITSELLMESRIPRNVRNAVARKGYRLVLKKDFDIYLGGAQAVAVDDRTGSMFGCADPRREGTVVGY